MSNRGFSHDVVILGAGLSGLLAAGTLRGAGLSVLVLDKARGVGGRMATRRIGPLVVDHGAQFFTAHDPRFIALVKTWKDAGVVRQWSTGFTGPDGDFRDNGVPRYCGVGGMTSISKHLAEGHDVRLQSRAVKIETQDGGWTVTLENGTTHTARAILLTAPVPQSLALLAEGKVSLPQPVLDIVEPLDYAPCITLLARLDRASRIPAPGGIWQSGEPLLFMADSRLKGLAVPPDSNETLLTIHGGQEFSQEHWSDAEETTRTAMLEAAAPWIGEAKVLETQIHRWRYSVPLRVHSEPTLLTPAIPGSDALPPLAFAGDAFGGPRIEAAALSGLAAGAALAERLKSAA